jgi:DNA-binding Lrp family transcriptional regulator
MDALDRKIIHVLQYEFPIEERPFDTLASRLGIGVDAFLDRVQSLLDRGVIRRLGTSFDSQKLGFRSTLAAVRVEATQVDPAAEVIGRHPEVTHSYLRDHAFNIWFTIIAPTAERIEEILQDIGDDLGLADADVLNLPMTRVFKLDARFGAKA